MIIRLYHKDVTEQVEVPYEKAQLLPEIIYRFENNEYKFFRRGSAANSTMYFEAKALHVPKTD